jgi:hypothetical protein
MPLIRRPIDRPMLLASLGLALGMMLIVYGFTTVQTGNESIGLPKEIQLISPQPDDRVLRQSPVSADLETGYTGKLVIDDTEIEVVEVTANAANRPGQPPADQILTTRFDPGSNTLTYQPADGAPIAQFAPGRHRVKLIYWRIDLGPESARTHTWDFNVTG